MKIKTVNKTCLTALAVVFPLWQPFAVAAEKPAAKNTTPKVAAPSTLKPNLPSKKLIEYGWDQFQLSDPAYIRDNIREMEKRPFDGIMFRMAASGGEVFNLEAWDPKALEPQLKVLSDIKWDKFTDNFLSVFSTCTMDWFSDADWEKVLAHTKFTARAVKAARCKGIMFDAEAYGGDRGLWYYDEKKTATGRSYAEYAQQVRKRGRQFMQALMSEKPDIRVLSLFNYSRMYTFSTIASDPLFKVQPEALPDPVTRAQFMDTEGYALLAPFTDGMIEVATGQVQVIDGNEFAYYYRTPMEFYKSAQAMRYDNKVFASVEARKKFSQYSGTSQALYVDWVYNLRPDLFTDIVTLGLSPEDRQRWFEQNAYYALKTTDEYVWVYSENMNWWRNENIPAGLETALISAKTKVAQNKELGFEVAPDVFKAAEEKVKAMKAGGKAP